MVEYLIKTNSLGGMTEEQFFDFCQENDGLRLERNASGEIAILSPTGNLTSWFNVQVSAELMLWNNQSRRKKGIILDSNAGITLPNNAVRSASGAFITRAQWQELVHEDREKFAHVCPVFIFEMCPESDSVDELKVKMEEYMDNGCLLSWLIDPKKKQTHVYRTNQEIETVSFDVDLSGEEVMPGFKINLVKLLKEDLD